jgi:ferrochelatase
MSEVKKGDPYPQYIEVSARGVAERLGLAAGRWQVTYQSRIGPTKWLGPDTVEFLERAARERAIVTVPIAFVSEHLETLYDLDMLAREAATKGGAIAYARAKAVGTRPEFVAALADIARAALAAPQRAA